MLLLKKLLLDLRFLQAAALVAAGVSEDKKCLAYMREIRAAEKAVERCLREVQP